ncbi:MAG TPA: F0F1 ATP synthase subunit delta [Candidatus Binatia bacterium]|nr:F0F1 ATP synthase subunit delta [Candidatus Binatia bacterium]
MKTPLHQVASVLAKQSLKAGSNQVKLSREIAAYLLASNRTGELESLLRDMTLYRAEDGIVEVTAVSAFDLPANIKQDVHAQVKQLYPKAKEIIINERRDPTLVGGLKLELPDAQLDLSIRAKLNRFRALTTAERTI